MAIFLCKSKEKEELTFYSEKEISSVGLNKNILNLWINFLPNSSLPTNNFFFVSLLRHFFANTQAFAAVLNNILLIVKCNNIFYVILIGVSCPLCHWCYVSVWDHRVDFLQGWNAEFNLFEICTQKKDIIQFMRLLNLQ